MKEFEKRFGKETSVISNWDEYTYYEGAREGWKEALEWAKKEGLILEETEGEYSIALIDVIQKELEDKYGKEGLIE